jgi:hypothetical protein
VASGENCLELRPRDPEECRVLTRAKTGVATAGIVLQQRLFTDMFELPELRKDDFVTVPVVGEHLNGASNDDIGTIAGLTLSEDERRIRELDRLGDLGERA